MDFKELQDLATKKFNSIDWKSPETLGRIGGAGLGALGTLALSRLLGGKRRGFDMGDLIALLGGGVAGYYGGGALGRRFGAKSPAEQFSDSVPKAVTEAPKGAPSLRDAPPEVAVPPMPGGNGIPAVKSPGAPSLSGGAPALEPYTLPGSVGVPPAQAPKMSPPEIKVPPMPGGLDIPRETPKPAVPPPKPFQGAMLRKPVEPPKRSVLEEAGAGPVVAGGGLSPTTGAPPYRPMAAPQAPAEKARRSPGDIANEALGDAERLFQTAGGSFADRAAYVKALQRYAILVSPKLGKPVEEVMRMADADIKASRAANAPRAPSRPRA